MNILVTGASGFLGHFLCKKLKEKGFSVVEVNSKNCDLTKENSLDIFDHLKFFQIYHLAAWTQAGDFCLRHQADQWIINQKINTNILSWWKEKQAQAKLICIGTSCSYDPSMPLLEENYLLGKPIDSLFTYAMTKRMLYAGVKALNEQYKMSYMCYVPSTLYGPNYHQDGRQMHFIFDLIRKILRGKYYGEKVILWGDGLQKRELIHVNDFINAMFDLNELENSTIINIGAGEGYSIKHFAEKICNVVGYDPKEIYYDTDKYTGARSKILSNEKIKRLLPKFCPIAFDDGIKDVVKWFIDNKNNLLKK